MSKEYRKIFGTAKISKEDMRTFCSRPGKHDEQGNIIYTTEQHHKNECDVNTIIRKYDKTGLISHISRFEASFGNLTGLDYKEAMDTVVNAQNEFNALPGEIRERFQNTPQKFLEFCENPDNRQEAIELGLIKAQWIEALDGLGEHVTKEMQNERNVNSHSEKSVDSTGEKRAEKAP